jgi:hypothetical protein
VTLFISGCERPIAVRTMIAPKVTLSKFRTFHLLPTPRRREAPSVTGAYDPMLNNSLANRAIRESVAGAFLDRGYINEMWVPDFVVAVYASAQERLDLSMWKCGYAYWPQGRWIGAPRQETMVYDHGTVIVDVLNPITLELLWRGSAQAVVSDDPAENMRQLQNVAAAIVEKFPRAEPRVVAHN